jgi:hypothetical protein
MAISFLLVKMFHGQGENGFALIPALSQRERVRWAKETVTMKQY